MKIWPKSKYSALCLTAWERFVLFYKEPRSTSRYIWFEWLVPALMTSLFLAGPRTSIGFGLTTLLLWYLVFERCIARTIFRLMDRAVVSHIGVSAQDSPR